MAPEAPRMIAIGMSKRKDKSHGHANRTPWRVAAREVPAAWLEDEAKHSPSPYSLLASWKGGRGGVPSHVMIKLLRRRLREEYPELMGTSLPPARLQRAHDMLKMIWERAGQRHPVWRLVEGLLRAASEHRTRRAQRRRPTRSPTSPGLSHKVVHEVR
jgi:hypothetical protein